MFVQQKPGINADHIILEKFNSAAYTPVLFAMPGLAVIAEVGAVNIHPRTVTVEGNNLQTLDQLA